MTRVDAPIAHAYRHGGAKEKAHTSCVPQKNTGIGRGRHCSTTYAPVAQMQEHLVRTRKVQVGVLPGALFVNWTSERVNARKPATEARLEVSIAPVKAIALYHCSGSQEPVMNTLRLEKQIQVLSMLVEGTSIRSIERVTGVHRDTILRLMVRAASSCARIMDEKLANLKLEEVEVDELWCYVGKKQKRVTATDNPREVGDQYVFVAMDAKSKIVPSFLVGKRTAENALHLMRDLQYRVANRITLTTDGFTPYIEAVEKSFGADVDFGQLVKIYSGNERKRERYSPSDFVRSFPTQIMGKSKRICTSYIERQNLTVRMASRRFTRLTNGFSKKLANLKAAVVLHFAHYNFMRVHRSLRVTPAMEAKVTDHIWTWTELLGTAN